jgi:Fe-S-cluster containining protein
MKIDFTPFFEKYKALSMKVDELFEKVQKEFPESVTCEIKCADCCHALFDLTLIEAIHINHRFNEMFEGKKKEAIIEKSNRADRKIHMIKRKAFKDKQAGKNDVEILMEIAAERVRCPLLNEDDMACRHLQAVSDIPAGNRLLLKANLIPRPIWISFKKSFTKFPLNLSAKSEPVILKWEICSFRYPWRSSRNLMKNILG